MQYAFIDGQRREPQPKLRATCPHCSSPVIAKCGTVKVWHWAHRGERNCDVWWEPETEWHRQWKGHFPVEWQEVAHRAADGERHIADVKTAHGLVLEFQHSFLQPEERMARSAFYGNMFWVVDGTRRLRDMPRYFREVKSWRRWNKHVFSSTFAEEALPAEWLNCPAPVFFDFGEVGEADRPRLAGADDLWCLLPGRVRNHAVVAAIPRARFIDHCRDGKMILDVRRLLTSIAVNLDNERLAPRLIVRPRRPAPRRVPGWQPAPKRRKRRTKPYYAKKKF